jgi:hypothetical protein
VSLIWFRVVDVRVVGLQLFAIMMENQICPQGILLLMSFKAFTLLFKEALSSFITYCLILNQCIRVLCILVFIASSCSRFKHKWSTRIYVLVSIISFVDISISMVTLKCFVIFIIQFTSSIVVLKYYPNFHCWWLCSSALRISILNKCSIVLVVDPL